VAGTTAAATIRSLDGEGSITILTDERRPLYARIRLPELLSGSVDAEKLTLRKASWYEREGIELRMGEPAIDVDPEARVVVTGKGTFLPYDRLLLAMGCSAFVPPIAGAVRPGVFTLRKMDDALAIKDRLRFGDHRVVIVGGGVLGLEVGNNLIRAGNRVEVVEALGRLLPRQTDPEASRMFQEQLESMGFHFQLAGRSKEIVGGEGGIEALRLEDGRTLECDTVIVSAGVRPNTALCERMGLKVGRGVVVDDRLATGVPDVYAAGDLISHRGVSYGIWPPAERQGEVAGTNMAGGAATYEGSTISNTLKVVGVDLFAAGDIDPAGARKSIIARDPDRHVYKKLVLEDGRIVGAILYGDVKDQKRVLRAIEARQDLSAVLDRVSCWDLSMLDEMPG
jgi:NAD(P)H-nitrite reductase large subunit